MTEPIRWTVQDRYGNGIYLTQERWEHIIDSINHPEMEDYEEELKETVRSGTRKQDSLNPQKYRYSKNLATYQQAILTSLLLCFLGFKKADLAKLNQIILLSPLTRKK